MKKLKTSVLAVVLSSQFVVVQAQEVQKDSIKTKEIGEVVITNEKKNPWGMHHKKLK